MATILIVEDELLIAEEIAYTVRELGHTALEPVASSDAALEILATQFVELVLMDVNIAGDTDGVATAVLARRHFAVPVVFLTARSDPATLNRAKLAHPYGYIVKPFTEQSLRAQLEMALFNAYESPGSFRPAPTAEPVELVPGANPLPEASTAKYLFVRKGPSNNHVKLLFSDILYFEARGNCVRLHTAAEKLVVDSTIKGLEQWLPFSFFRTHRSFVVNLDHVSALDEGGVIINQEFIPVGRSFKDELKKRIQLLG